MYMFINDIFLNVRCFMYVHIKYSGNIITMYRFIKAVFLMLHFLK